MPTFYRGLSNGGSLALTVTPGSQNIANNTTSVSRSVTIKDTSDIRMWAQGAWSAQIRAGSTTMNNNSGNGYNFNGATVTHTFVSGTSNLTHNANGARSDTWYGQFWDIPGAGWFGGGTAQGSVTLKTIPRATTPNSGNFTTGQATTINLPRASSSFTHQVTYKFGTSTGTIATAAGTTASWTPPHTLFNQYPNSASGSVTITVQTKSGSTNIGSAVTMTKTLTLHSGQVPSIGSVTWTDQNARVRTNIGAYVAGMSRLTANIGASGVVSSTISRRDITVAGTTAAQDTPLPILTAGEQTVRASVTDSRSRSVYQDTTINALSYSEPQVTGTVRVRRALSNGTVNDEGTYLRVDLNVSATSLIRDSIQRNALSITFRTKQTNGTFVTRQTLTPGLNYNSNVLISGGGIYLASNSYDVEVVISDNVIDEPLRFTVPIPTAKVTMDMDGTNVGIGGYYRPGNGVLDVHGDIYQNGGRVANLSDVPVPATVQEVQEGVLDTGYYVSPATISRETWSYSSYAPDYTGPLATTEGSSNIAVLVDIPPAPYKRIVQGFFTGWFSSNSNTGDTQLQAGVQFYETGTGPQRDSQEHAALGISGRRGYSSTLTVPFVRLIEANQAITMRGLQWGTYSGTVNVQDGNGLCIYIVATAV